jgi:hypothetical protein
MELFYYIYETGRKEPVEFVRRNMGFQPDLSQDRFVILSEGSSVTSEHRPGNSDCMAIPRASVDYVLTGAYLPPNTSFAAITVLQ